MSCMAFTPFREIAVHALQVRKHCSLLARDHLAKHASAQASWRCPYQLAPKSVASSNRVAVTLTMANREREVQTVFPSAPPLADPVERISGGTAPRTNHSRPHPALSSAHDRHRPFAEHDLGLGPAGRDHGAGRGDPYERGVGYHRPLQHDRSPDFWEPSHGQTGRVAREATIGELGLADPGHQVKFSFDCGREGSRMT